MCETCGIDLAWLLPSWILYSFSAFLTFLSLPSIPHLLHNPLSPALEEQGEERPASYNYSRTCYEIRSDKAESKLLQPLYIWICTFTTPSPWDFDTGLIKFMLLLFCVKGIVLSCVSITVQLRCLCIISCTLTSLITIFITIKRNLSYRGFLFTKTNLIIF